MANLTDGYEIELLNGLTGETPLTTPTTVYLALFTADPTDTGSVTNELTGGAYARTALTGAFPTATGTAGTVANDVQIDFPTATADWSQVTHVGFMKAGTSAVADMMLWITLESPITILDTQVFSFSVGNLTVTVA